MRRTGIDVVPAAPWAATESALRRNQDRFRLLSDTASLLLASDKPQEVVNRLCRDVMDHLDCHVFFNYLVDESASRLRLNACAGLPDEEIKRARWLDFGVAICGCVARDRERIIAEDIQATTDPRADMLRSCGIQAYCCHPLVAQGRLIGTLSFGTRSQPRFSPEDVALMKTVTDEVAVAMQRVQAQEALRLANAQLLDSDRRKNEFLAVLSHELRNPLAPISNSLHVLENVHPGASEAKRAKAIIGRQVVHLTHLVDDLLDVTRVSRNKIRLQREPVDLRDVVRRSVEDQRSLFEKSGVRLDLAVPSEPLPATADPTRVAQIVGNILQNAAKFTGRGGSASIAVTADLRRRHAVIRVTDTGVGMTPKTLAGLFQPFMQADQTLDRSKGGLGLGLALVKGLVDLHGGSVTAHSEGLGRGAVFLVRLPLERTKTPAPTLPRTASPGVRRRVLIIEDNVDSADSLREVLKLSRHEVAVAYSGPAGLAVARQLRPEIVLCDLGLPEMDGYAVARVFRSEPALAGTYLVAVSGYASPDDLERTAKAGFARHLAKPPSVEMLEEVLGNAPTIPPPRRSSGGTGREPTMRGQGSREASPSPRVGANRRRRQSPSIERPE